MQGLSISSLGLHVEDNVSGGFPRARPPNQGQVGRAPRSLVSLTENFGDCATGEHSGSAGHIFPNDFNVFYSQ